MKHLFIFLVCSLVSYFGWYYAEKPVKRFIKRLTKRHIIAVGTVFILAFAGLLLMFYNRAFSLL